MEMAQWNSQDGPNWTAGGATGWGQGWSDCPTTAPQFSHEVWRKEPLVGWKTCWVNLWAIFHRCGFGA